MDAHHEFATVGELARAFASPRRLQLDRATVAVCTTVAHWDALALRAAVHDPGRPAGPTLTADLSGAGQAHHLRAGDALLLLGELATLDGCPLLLRVSLALPAAGLDYAAFVAARTAMRSMMRGTFGRRLPWDEQPPER